ncbi:hypothetical protein AB0J80_27465 [Actinoplanes sp. NPDC049548]|uniref:hypothetical protein n=1 Tax=Actinoplanes sp. NPDC049548 TaxID=3155152 RepID=UPI00342C3E3A
MRRSRSGIVVSSVIAVAFLSGCTTESDQPATVAAPVSAPASAAPSPSAAGLDAATKKACKGLLAAVKDTTAKVADAEKIGPPAGHFAVGAAYAAGSAQLAAESIGSTDERVSAAADGVSAAMMDLDKAQQKDPEGKPSKAKLKAAVADLKKVCSAG